MEFAVKIKTTSLPFVKIKIGDPNNSRPREWSLNRWQFELILIIVPVFLIWGIVSTGILLRGLGTTGIQHPLVSTEVIPEAAPAAESGAATVSEKAAEAAGQFAAARLPRVAAAVTENSSRGNLDVVPGATRTLGETSFTMSDVIKVRAKILGRSTDGPFRISFDAENLTGTLLKGKMSIQVTAQSMSGTPLLFDATRINVGGEKSKGGNKIIFYSFTHARQQELELIGEDSAVAKFTGIIVTLTQDGYSPTEEKFDF